VDAELALVLGLGYWILVDRIVRRFKPLPVLFCSIYEPAMWRHERYWKVPSTGFLAAFAGTPFINMILRRVSAPMNTAPMYITRPPVSAAGSTRSPS
jgi:hypothetical protein